MNLCECGWFATVAESMTVTCPLCSKEFTALTHEDAGRQAWSILHSMSPDEVEDVLDWLEHYVPNFQCSCHAHFYTYVEEHPIDLDNFFAWGVGLHNWVNVRLGKPVMSLEDALAMYEIPN